MAFVVRRKDGRWEIRESETTPKGPRARTLVSFTELTPQVLQRASAAAHRPFRPEKIIAEARRKGAVIADPSLDSVAHSLIRRLARGDRLSTRSGRRLEQALGGTLDSDVAEWIGASAEDRGRALIDLLELADAIPKSPGPKPLRFPGLRSR